MKYFVYEIKHIGASLYKTLDTIYTINKSLYE